MHFIIKLLFFLFITTNAFSQKTACHKFIPYFRTLNVEKLSYRLTNDLQNDSAKVYAIHCWVTHHIKYDVKKRAAFDYTRMPIKTILRKRKATCIGYSDLFNELCKYANIISTDIPGYVKNENVDLNDKFYLDEHIWNAVYVNNNWKLVDACWDAGYIKQYKRSFFGYVVYFFSMGTNEIVKYKPNFIFNPKNTYYFKNGNEFIFDHIPSNPIWQFTNPIKTIEQFEADSSFYLHTKRVSNNSDLGSKYTEERRLISQMTQKEKDIYNGSISNEFNYKNHYPIAISQFILASDLYNEIDNKSKDSIMVLNQCNNALFKFNLAKLHFDSTMFYLNMQKIELKINNQSKNDTLEIQNKKLISSTMICERKIKSGGRISINADITLKRIDKTNNARLTTLINNTKFVKTKRLKNYISIDSTNAVRKTEVLNDSVTLINITMTKQFKRLDSLYYLYLNRFANYSYGSNLNALAIEKINKSRMSYSDDLDYEIRNIKDSIMKYKFDFDSSLLTTDNVFIVKSLLNEINKVKADFKILYGYHKSLANEYVKLKKYHVDYNVLSVLYGNNLMQYANEIEQRRIALNRNKIYFIELSKLCKKQIKPSNKERKYYIKEKHIEMKMFSLRNNYITRHYDALSKLSRKKIIEIEKMKTKIMKTKIKYNEK